MIEPNLKSICKYCSQEIDTDADGWGGSGELDVFHLECLQLYEGVSL